MVCDRPLGEAQLVCDRGVGQAVRDLCEHLLLPEGQPGRVGERGATRTPEAAAGAGSALPRERADGRPGAEPVQCGESIAGGAVIIGVSSVKSWPAAVLGLVSLGILILFKKVPEPVLLLASGLVGYLVLA